MRFCNPGANIGRSFRTASACRGGDKVLLRLATLTSSRVLCAFEVGASRCYRPPCIPVRSPIRHRGSQCLQKIVSPNIRIPPHGSDFNTSRTIQEPGNITLVRASAILPSARPPAAGFPDNGRSNEGEGYLITVRRHTVIGILHLAMTATAGRCATWRV